MKYIGLHHRRLGVQTSQIPKKQLISSYNTQKKQPYSLGGLFLGNCQIHSLDLQLLIFKMLGKIG